MSTLKLYDEDAYKAEFEAVILSCRAEGDGSFLVELDRTLFFPEEGGQDSDRGELSLLQGGERPKEATWKVIDVQIKDTIWHRLEGSIEPEPGMRVFGKIDFKERYDKMQNHSGEHIISGLACAGYHCDNVGFRLNSELVTIDLNTMLTPEQVAILERKANEVVWADVPITAVYYTPEEVQSRTYRSKKEIDGDVRLVYIGEEGEYDICACCAPHVRHTGEIGLIKIIRQEKWKSGIRLTVFCGARALRDYDEKHAMIEALARDFSARPEQVRDRVEDLKRQLRAAGDQIASLQEKEIRSLLESGDIVIMDAKPKASIVTGIMDDTMNSRPDSVIGIFLGSDETSYRYTIGSRNRDVTPLHTEMKAALGAKGGGNAVMVQGQLSATKEKILSFFNR